jgi:hypothetical protein
VTWSIINNGVQNTGATSGSYGWIVTGPVTNAARIRATWTTNAVAQDVSDVNFRVAPGITVTSPNTNVSWAAASRRTITWNHTLGINQSFQVDASTNNGATWVGMGGSVATSPTTGSLTIYMPNVFTSQALIRVSPAGNPGDGDVSDVPFTLAVPAVTVTAPNTNVNWEIGTSRNITWSHNLGTAEAVRLERSTDGGATWSVITSSVQNDGNTSGSYSWIVPAPVTNSGRVRVTWTSNAIAQDVSDVNFRVASGITVTSPNTNVSWAAGSRRTITWNHTLGLNQQFLVEASTDNGATWVAIGGSVATSATTGSLTTPMPSVITSQALIRVSPAGSPGDGDVSNVPFTLAPGTISVTAPNSGVSWPIGANRTITWSHNLGDLETVRIEVSRDGGTTWELITASVVNTNNGNGSFTWAVTGPATTTARIRVTWTQNTVTTDASNVNFTIN